MNTETGAGEFGFVNVMNTGEIERYRGYAYWAWGEVGQSAIDAHLESLVVHIYAVMVAGQKLGVDEGQLMLHDQSKFTNHEFPQYALHFHAGPQPDLFSGAWLHHLHANAHHWQHWMFPDGHVPHNSGVVSAGGVMEMPENYALEMVADWMGASYAYTKTWDMAPWLEKHIPKIILHPRTAVYVAELLSGLGYGELVQTHQFGSGGQLEHQKEWYKMRYEALARSLGWEPEEYQGPEYYLRRNQEVLNTGFKFKKGEKAVLTGLVDNPEADGTVVTILAYRTLDPNRYCPSGRAYYTEEPLPGGGDFIYEERLVKLNEEEHDAR